ncbi:chemotaxis response regulator protein-glutamate methylesterase [Thermodesulfobacterium sp. TA1]|uniref:protein-glutamate methylesterase/protein-glutamine glutaminase n=1 Tax=Thermodesulfobacterium sp. TA1 TaxID=2234087 RepID=UPI001232732D|nr:chemotaxis response regulator protein-glutamate methylesterase [Thermodesulfobacterium sp. TA1]QER42118.1 chemotaxis response regulator protein-glutamate methylesterase [Thermodesulfobacterium sp. TA1]
MIRVLVVDDSAIMRKLIVDILKEEKDIEVVDTAKNGKEAIEKAKTLKPDVITLDIEMPEMDGIEALKFLRKEVPSTKVIMFSSLTQEGAKATIEALALGAYDFVPKPSTKSFLESVKQIKDQLIPKIKSVVPLKRIQSIYRPSQVKKVFKKEDLKVLGIGVSTGGPQTLMQIIPKLPKSFPVPILIVQHMPPVFTKQLAERLDSLSELKVKEGEQGEPVRSGMVYIAPGDFHMVVKKDNAEPKIRLHQGPPRNFCRPAVDELFESIAEVYEGASVGLILTGMGSDGKEGAKKIKEQGGVVLAQDAETSIVFGMPKAVIEAGLADEVLSLDQIPQRLKEIFKV